MSEQQIRTAARLYEMRDAAKRFLGDGYAERIRRLREPIETVQRKDKCDPLVAAMTIAKGTEANGYETIFIVAAAVEMIEPSVCCRQSPCLHPGVGPCDMPASRPTKEGGQ